MSNSAKRFRNLVAWACCILGFIVFGVMLGADQDREYPGFTFESADVSGSWASDWNEVSSVELPPSDEVGEDALLCDLVPGEWRYAWSGSLAKVDEQWYVNTSAPAWSSPGFMTDVILARREDGWFAVILPTTDPVVDLSPMLESHKRMIERLEELGHSEHRQKFMVGYEPLMSRVLLFD